MSKKMLVDASHPEETRVVVLSGNRVEEFDYENAGKLQLKGNIYLAKVTRVEPSLQACFVEFGGNRHGFLPFSEIHPDYYRIPKEDRIALLAAEKAEQRHRPVDDDDDEGPDDETANGDDAGGAPSMAGSEAASGPDAVGEMDGPAPAAETQDDIAGGADPDEGGDAPGDDQPQIHSGADDRPNSLVSVETAIPAEEIETLGSEDALEEVPTRKPRHMRRYKIQEVIVRKQILLIQVVKEERGSKGAALTTFLSLAGRYCVLMPNTDRGGGISRKIANPADRRKLKELASELDVPEGMGLIIRTAGANRTKQEIRRDYEYLLREWEAVRDLTLKSTAPALVYEEGSLIKRAIRDLFSKDIDQIVVEGDAGHDEARDFMRLIMPSHVDMVEKFAQPLPLYQAYGVEAQLDSMFQPTVRLRSGGYIVINQTEALVAVDVNSGKATREHNIEDTALKTNLEAAEEVARQLRLRDLAGLIVIDFIDMQEGRNNRHVEKRLKDALKWDRARIQVGRISPFGLLEMSRQRLRSGMVEGSTVSCPHCEGRGFIRSVGSMALRVLRAVEEHCQRQKEPAITLRLPPEIAIYILNHKRGQLTGIEERYGVYIYIEAKPSLTASTYEIERGAAVVPEPRRIRKAAGAVSLGAVFEEFPIQDDVAEQDDAEPSDDGQVEDVAAGDQPEDDQRGGRRRRRRRGRGQRDGAGPREDAPREPAQARAQPQQPRPQPSERPFGVPSPAEFNFGHHDLPDTSPDAVDFDGGGQDDDGDQDDDQPANQAANGARPDAAERDGERRRRRGRRGRRGRGRDRGRDGGPRGGDQPAHAEASNGDARHTPRPDPAPQPAMIADEPSPAAAYAHPNLIRPQPQFSLNGEEDRPAAQETPVAPTPPPQPAKAEPKSEWRLSSLFGFGPKEPPKEPPKPAPAPPPVIVQELVQPEPAEGNDHAAAESDPNAPKRGGWWQKR